MDESKLEKYRSIGTNLRALRKVIKLRDENDAQNLEDRALQFIEQMRKAYAEDGNAKWVTDAILQCGVLEIIDSFLDSYSWRTEAVASYEEAATTGKGKRVLICYDHTLRCVVEATYRHVSVCVYAIEKGVMEVIMSELKKAALLKQRCLPCDSLLADIAKDFIMILSNICVRTSAGVSKVSKDNNSVLKKYCDGDNYELMQMALFTLSRLANENEKLSMSYGLADFIVRLLKAALSGNFSGFSVVATATSLLESLCQLANCSDNCVTKIVNAGILDVLDAVLLAPDASKSHSDQLEHTPPSDPACLVQVTSDVEKSLTIKLLYMAKFSKDVRKIIAARRTTVAALKRLAKSYPHAETKREAKNLLASLFAARLATRNVEKLNLDDSATGEKRRASARLLDRRRQLDARMLPAASKLAEDDKTTAAAACEAKRDRIFVSYSHKQQQLVFAVVDRLRAAGFVNVVTDQSIESDWYTWMVEQVEQADIVLVCFSESYYQSGNCKDEATNARALGKTIIPLKMEDYTPISWLGGITRVRLWRDYWNPSCFEESVSKLIDEIKTYLSVQASQPAEVRAQNIHSHAAWPTSPLSIPSTPVLYEEPLASLKMWDQQKSKLWLSSIGYPATEVQTGAIDGTFVYTLVQLARKEPKYLVKALLQHKGVSLDQAVVTLGKLSDGPKV